jgi:hypothetical protein
MRDSFAWQALSFLGALLILVAYIAHQMDWMDSRRPLYNILNAIGSGILGYMAFFPFRLGFVFLELTWVGISIYAMFRYSRRREA